MEAITTHNIKGIIDGYKLDLDIEEVSNIMNKIYVQVEK
jgi:hypothetical protein